VGLAETSEYAERASAYLFGCVQLRPVVVGWLCPTRGPRDSLQSARGRINGDPTGQHRSGNSLPERQFRLDGPATPFTQRLDELDTAEPQREYRDPSDPLPR
jgi:hypothetical protein